MDCTDTWRLCRKMTHREFHAGPFKRHRPVLARQLGAFVRGLVADGGANLPAHLTQ